MLLQLSTYLLSHHLSSLLTLQHCWKMSLLFCKMFAFSLMHWCYFSNVIRSVVDVTAHLVVFSGDLQQHLQTMFTLLRPEDTIRLVASPSVSNCFIRDPLTVCIKCNCITSPITLFFRRYAWRVPTLSVHAIWWWCPPTEGRTLRRVWSLAWTSPTRSGLYSSPSYLYSVKRCPWLPHKCLKACFLCVCLSYSSQCTVGLVLPLWSDTLIHLDGDG